MFHQSTKKTEPSDDAEGASCSSTPIDVDEKPEAGIPPTPTPMDDFTSLLPTVHYNSLRFFGYQPVGNGTSAAVYSCFFEKNDMKPPTQSDLPHSMVIKKIRDNRLRPYLVREVTHLVQAYQACPSGVIAPVALVMDYPHRNLSHRYCGLILEAAECTLHQLMTGHNARRLWTPSGGYIETSKKLLLLIQLLHIVDILHENGLFHGDYRPTNILLVDTNHEVPTLKLCDFGLAGTQDTLHAMQNGTESYAAPEIIKEGEKKNHGAPTQMFAIGAVLCELLNECTNFYPGINDDILNGYYKYKINSTKFRTQFRQIGEARTFLHRSAAANLELNRLISALTAHNPEDRPSARIALDVLRSIYENHQSDKQIQREITFDDGTTIKTKPPKPGR